MTGKLDPNWRTIDSGANKILADLKKKMAEKKTTPEKKKDS